MRTAHGRPHIVGSKFDLAQVFLRANFSEIVEMFYINYDI